MFEELSRLSQESDKLERRYARKDKFKKGFKSMFGMASKQEAPPVIDSQDLAKALSDIAASKKKVKDHHVDLMLNAYEELYKNVKVLKISSIEPVAQITFFLFIIDKWI